MLINATTPDGLLEIVDQGSYQVTESSWNQSSTAGLGNAEGSFTFDGSILNTDVISNEQRVESIWRKVQ